jgi:hypothetical protein
MGELNRVRPAMVVVVSSNRDGCLSFLSTRRRLLVPELKEANNHGLLRRLAEYWQKFSYGYAERENIKKQFYKLFSSMVSVELDR